MAVSALTGQGHIQITGLDPSRIHLGAKQDRIAGALESTVHRARQLGEGGGRRPEFVDADQRATLVPTGHGINCEMETQRALELAGFGLVDSPEQADVILLNGYIPNAGEIASQVEAVRGLVLIMGPQVWFADAETVP